MTQSNELLEWELEWLMYHVARLVRRSAGWLDSEGSEEKDAILSNHIKEVAFIGKLLDNKRVLPEDRVGLMLILLDERRKLPANLTEISHQQENIFIDSILRHLSEVDWEALGTPETPYDPSEHWGGFRLTEGEMGLALGFAGIQARFTEDYEKISPGSKIRLVNESGQKKPPAAYVIRLTRTHDAATTLNVPGVSSKIPGKIFEGIITETTEEGRVSSDKEAFGFLYSGGMAIWIDSHPNSGYIDRVIFTEATIQSDGKYRFL
jgi:hypothetical protein